MKMKIEKKLLKKEEKEGLPTPEDKLEEVEVSLEEITEETIEDIKSKSSGLIQNGSEKIKSIPESIKLSKELTEQAQEETGVVEDIEKIRKITKALAEQTTENVERIASDGEAKELLPTAEVLEEKPAEAPVEGLSKEEVERLKEKGENAEVLLGKLESGQMDSFDNDSLELLQKVLSDKNKGGILSRIKNKGGDVLGWLASKAGPTVAGWYAGAPLGGEMGRQWAENAVTKWIQEAITIEGPSQVAAEGIWESIKHGAIEMGAKATEWVAETGPAKAVIETIANAGGAVGKVAGGVAGFMITGMVVGSGVEFFREFRKAKSFDRVKSFMEKSKLYMEEDQKKEEFKEKQKAKARGEKEEGGWLQRKAGEVVEGTKQMIRKEWKGEKLKEMGKEVETGRDPRLELLAMHKRIVESPDQLGIDLTNDEWVQFVASNREAKMSLIRERMKPRDFIGTPEIAEQMEQNVERVEQFLGNQEKMAEADLDAAASLLLKFERDLKEDVAGAETQLEDYSTIKSKLKRYGGAIIRGGWRGTHIPMLYKVMRTTAKVVVKIATGGLV